MLSNNGKPTVYDLYWCPNCGCLREDIENYSSKTIYPKSYDN